MKKKVNKKTSTKKGEYKQIPEKFRELISIKDPWEAHKFVSSVIAKIMKGIMEEFKRGNEKYLRTKNSARAMGLYATDYCPEYRFLFKESIFLPEITSEVGKSTFSLCCEDLIEKFTKEGSIKFPERKPKIWALLLRKLRLLSCQKLVSFLSRRIDPDQKHTWETATTDEEGKKAPFFWRNFLSEEEKEFLLSKFVEIRTLSSQICFCIARFVERYPKWREKYLRKTEQSHR